MSLACAPNAFRIEAIPHGRGLIGLSVCPGPEDLAEVAAFRPDAIATLVSSHELRLIGRADLVDKLPTLASQWHHVPMRAGGGLDPRFERLWSYAGHRLRAVLRRGGRVLLHCDGGGARARQAAARLLAELGVPPGEAAARARARSVPAPPRLAEHHLAGRILGGLFGGALGDAYGYPVEFKSRAQIRKASGPDGLMPPTGRLVASDDTQMTLFTGEGLLNALSPGGPPSVDRIVARVRHAYLVWFRTQRDEWTSAAVGLSQHPELWALRAPGSTCVAAVRAGARGTPAAPVNDSKGSGAVMRIAPLGLVPAIDADLAFRLADTVAALTHGHPIARLSAAALASLLRDLVDETPMTAALDRMEARLQTARGGEEVLTAVRAARRLAACADMTTADAIAALGQGWTGEEALAIGLYAALRADRFEDALRLAAEHDGDSDTTAAIAGQIWGVLYGLDVAPHAWIQRLDLLEPLCDVAGRLAAHAASQATPLGRPQLAMA